MTTARQICLKCGAPLKLVAAANPEWRDWICVPCGISYGPKGAHD